MLRLLTIQPQPQLWCCAWWERRAHICCDSWPWNCKNSQTYPKIHSPFSSHSANSSAILSSFLTYLDSFLFFKWLICLYLISRECLSLELLNVQADIINRQFVVLMKIFLCFQQMAKNVAFVICSLF